METPLSVENLPPWRMRVEMEQQIQAEVAVKCAAEVAKGLMQHKLGAGAPLPWEHLT
jgi:hypothetical protein